jgi:hypothetical protein
LPHGNPRALPQRRARPAVADGGQVSIRIVNYAGKHSANSIADAPHFLAPKRAPARNPRLSLPRMGGA